jgi:hypothetical protein
MLRHITVKFLMQNGLLLMANGFLKFLQTDFLEIW